MPLVAKNSGDKTDDYWAYFWPSVCGLLWILKHLNLSGKQVIEIGAGGSGVVGVTAARSGASRVLTTDYVRLATQLLQLNASSNGISSNILQASTLDWNEPSTWPADQGGFDVVLASDVLYDEKHVAPLCKLLLYVLSPR